MYITPLKWNGPEWRLSRSMALSAADEAEPWEEASSASADLEAEYGPRSEDIVTAAVCDLDRGICSWEAHGPQGDDSDEDEDEADRQAAATAAYEVLAGWMRLVRLSPALVAADKDAPGLIAQAQQIIEAHGPEMVERSAHIFCAADWSRGVSDTGADDYWASKALVASLDDEVLWHLAVIQITGDGPDLECAEEVIDQWVALVEAMVAAEGAPVWGAARHYIAAILGTARDTTAMDDSDLGLWLDSSMEYLRRLS